LGRAAIIEGKGKVSFHLRRGAEEEEKSVAMGSSRTRGSEIPCVRSIEEISFGVLPEKQISWDVGSGSVKSAQPLLTEEKLSLFIANVNNFRRESKHLFCAPLGLGVIT
jgi:hypothetical protein